VLLQLYFTVDIDTFAWYKEAIRGRVKSLILLMLNSLRDNPPLGTISSHKSNAIDGRLDELISLDPGCHSGQQNSYSPIIVLPRPQFDF
jgi:hypothetical protein